ncbi:hypothetical protein NHX12_031565 [Muraenolepis orangiensis]|uniref:High affinity choline transporter 1 n=1 Tax=Muraenolepis orangiensis TaxID=630683 RepID=A0A9Q0E4Q4_9TELE|nr:hypothetical protein NHX12_031565 [Muraenolepis orangiensis]
MALNIPGVVVMVFFYLMVFGTGIWASFKSKKVTKKTSADQIEMTLLGNRGISLVVGMFTMSATWIGGGFLCSFAEAAYYPSRGILDALHMVIAYCFAFIICGLVFAKPMRDRRFVTMLDPFHIKYGNVACIFTIISLIADLIWVPTTLSALAFIIFAIPPTIIGAVAITADWNKTSYGSPSPLERGEGANIFPITLNNLTPPYIAICGISAVAAAVMSSADSALLSGATTFSTNIYKGILRPQASSRELKWVIQAVVVVIGIGGTSLTSFEKGVLALWYIVAEMNYVFMFPQLICVLFFDVANVYGSVMGFLVSLLLRLLCGWSIFGIPAVLHLPGGSYENGVYIQRFPFNTLCMLCSLASILLFSYLAALQFDKGIIPESWDMLNFLKLPRKLPPMGASKEDKKKEDPHQDPSEPMMNTSC